MKTSLSEHAAYSIVGVYVMQSKVKLTFQKHFENTRKKGARGPLGPSPKSAYDLHTKTFLGAVLKISPWNVYWRKKYLKFELNFLYKTFLINL